MAFCYEKGRTLRLFRFNYQNELQSSTGGEISTETHSLFRGKLNTIINLDNNRHTIVRLELHFRCHSNRRFSINNNRNLQLQASVRNHNEFELLFSESSLFGY
jgi:hypothetical protein